MASGRTSKYKKSIVQCMLNRNFQVQRVSPEMKLRRCLLKILSGASNNSLASLFSLAKLKKMKKSEEFTVDSELQALIRQIMDKLDAIKVK